MGDVGQAMRVSRIARGPAGESTVLTSDGSDNSWTPVADIAGSVGFPRVIKDGVSIRVQDGFILPADVELPIEGSGELHLEGDAELRLYSNWAV